ncbi:hypothetical protein [Halalkalibacter alkaliphilus]|uniref:Uncharacterized protein n=1 Tax=Halalkalibacter alkaliphilus TaxID=2917993 RepID=A0A9X2I6X1_9BACI|nr:hypothetical protein [Halalkalibacter alkaliphilus]MCL7748898.1 hypothetical protein [Halalkalibacter alkaliphilus]
MKRSIAILIFICLFVTACHKDDVNEDEVLSIFDEFLEHVHELFAYHTYDEQAYYNGKYHTEDEIRKFLGRFMTDAGMEQLLDDIYVQNNERYVYQEEFQSYLSNEDSSYYEITRQTVFNPGLRMIMGDDLQIYEAEGKIELRAEHVPIQFYAENSLYGHSQFGELGYPSVDYLSLYVSMVKDEKTYRIKRIEVNSL